MGIEDLIAACLAVSGAQPFQFLPIEHETPRIEDKTLRLEESV
jgi:hypothetical protein